MESPENPFDKLYQQITSGYNDKGKKLGNMFNKRQPLGDLKTSDGEKEIVPELIKEALEKTNKKMEELYGSPEEEIATYTHGMYQDYTSLGFFERKYNNVPKKFVIKLQIFPSEFYNEQYCNNEKKCDSNKENWEKADEEHLSPKLYFYKEVDAIYEPNPQYKKQMILICIVNEAFNSDLNNFLEYNETVLNNSEVAEKMVMQITDLYTTMVKKMNMICFDIKLQNIAIKFERVENVPDLINKPFTIKLIDWDSDWCMIPDTFWNREIKFEGTVINKEEKKEIIIMLILMFVANFFYIRGNNIFRVPIKNFVKVPLNIQKMLLIFNEYFTPEKSDKQDDIYFAIMAASYFGGIDIEALFYDMLKKALSKNKKDYKNIKNIENVNLFAYLNDDERSENIVTGGKKNKRKTKRKYKTKTKNVRNKKKKGTRKKR